MYCPVLLFQSPHTLSQSTFALTISLTLCLIVLHTDYAWDVITEFATELLDTQNLEKDQVRNIYSSFLLLRTL